MNFFATIFIILILCHFVFDWVFQTEYEAINKSKNYKIRAKHCLIYSLLFAPVFYLYNINLFILFILLFWLFLSHFIEDTYIPVALWAKYIRKSKHFNNNNLEDGFKKFVSEPIGIILAITIDQLIHILCLVPVAWWVFKMGLE